MRHQTHAIRRMGQAGFALTLAACLAAAESSAAPRLIGPGHYKGFCDSPFEPLVPATNGPGSYFYLDDIEDGFFDPQGLDWENLDVNYGSAQVDSVDEDDSSPPSSCVSDGTGAGGHSLWLNSPGEPHPAGGYAVRASALWDSLPNVMGIVLTDPDQSCVKPIDITISAYGADSNAPPTGVFHAVVKGDNSFTGGTSDDYFVGLVDDAGLRGMTIAIDCNTGGDVEYDHVQYGLVALSGSTACSNGIDDDMDGLVDTADLGCGNAGDDSEKKAGLACDDGIDNDGDRLVDLLDPQCTSTVGREGGCGIGFELAGLALIFRRLRRIGSA